MFDDIRKLHALKEELIMIELRNNFECHNPLPKWDVTWQPVDDIKQKDCMYPKTAFYCKAFKHHPSKLVPGCN